jgi:predicted RND superfamily exporter protein
VKGAERAVRFFWRYRVPLFILSLIAWGFSLVALGNLRVANSLDVWYPLDSAELRRYESFKQLFGNDEFVVVAVTGDEPFDSEEGQEVIEAYTERFYDIDGVATITSLLTVPSSMRDVRARLLSDDGQTTIILMQMIGGPEAEEARPLVLAEIRAVIADMGLEARLAGNGVIYDALNEASTTGARELLASAHVAMFILLAIFYRRLVPVVATLLAVIMATSWMMGIYALMGRPLNMVTMALPTLVLVMGVANCAHLLRSVARTPDSGDHELRVITGLARTAWPCCVTSFTTAVGFLSLSVAPLPVIADLGLYGAAGMIFALLASFIVVSFFLAWQATVPRFSPGGTLSRLSRSMTAIACAAPRRTIALFAALGVVAVFGVLRLDADTNSIAYLPKNHPVRMDSEFIEGHIGAYASMDFLVLGSANPVTDLDMLDAVQQWQAEASQLPKVDWSWSLIDALSVSEGETPSVLGADAMQTRLARVERLFPLTTRTLLGDGNVLRVSFGVPMQSAGSARALVRDLTDLAKMPPGIHVEVAGYIPLYTRIIDEIVSSQLRGFAVAIPLIMILLGVALRSWASALLAMPASLLPILATLGLMGWVAIPLDVATATIATVVLGLVVDDAVHLLHHANQNGIPGRPDISGLIRANAATGSTLLLTSIVLVTGFLLLGLAEIRSIRWFGLLGAFAMAFAIVADMMLLPAVAFMQRKFNPARRTSQRRRKIREIS